MELFPANTKIEFMKIRVASMTATAVICLAAVFFLAADGFNYALDFTGGTATEIKFERPVVVEQVREQLERAGYRGAVVQTFGTGNDIVIRLQPQEGTEGEPVASTDQGGAAILAVVQSPDNPGAVIRSDFVGPQIGDELALNGLYAALFVVLGFLVYIWVRFELKFAIAAIITTLVDMLVVCGWFAYTGRDFDLTVLAGILSVMGFSINDTIVVFDRVRENFRTISKLSPIEVLNRSINQTLSRTVLTSVVAFLVVTALYLYGGQSLRGMAEAQMIGVVFGTLSSILVACPLLLVMNVTKQDLLPKAREDLEAELARRP